MAAGIGDHIWIVLELQEAAVILPCKFSSLAETTTKVLRMGVTNNACNLGQIGGEYKVNPTPFGLQHVDVGREAGLLVAGPRHT